MRFIYSSISWGYPFIGTLVIPGKSTNVKSTTFCEYIVRDIGSSDIFLSIPASLAVWSSISFLTF